MLLFSRFRANSGLPNWKHNRAKTSNIAKLENCAGEKQHKFAPEDMERWGTCCCLNPELRGGQRVGHLPRWILHEAGRYTVLLYSLFLIYRRRIKTEDKAKVVAAVWGTKFIHLLAALAILN